MQKIADLIDRTNGKIGQSVIWLVLLLVFLQFFVVVLRYVFGLNFIDLQEIITIAHGLIFMAAAGYVLQIDHHVRVDIFYAGFSARLRAMINMFGSLLFLIPAMVVIVYLALPYVGQSWLVLEGASDAEFLNVRYLQKSAILAFALLLGLQGLSIFLRGLLALAGDRAELEKISTMGSNSDLS